MTTFRTVTGADQQQRRAALLRQLSTRVDAANFAMFGLVTDGDCVRYDRLVARGAGRDLWPRASGRLFSGPWSPVRLRNGQIHRFVRGRLPERPIRRAFYEPLGLGTDLRMLIYDGDRFVAWLGLSREEGAAPFTRSEIAQLDEVRESLVSLAIAASVADAPSAEALQDAFVTLTPEGQVESASPSARAHLSRGLRRELADHVRRLDDDTPPVVMWEGIAVRVVRLDGGGRVRYLAALRPTGPIASSLVRLTESQYRIAELAAAGATVPEVARDLSISNHTVRQHLKAIYRRLDIGARVELAEVFLAAQRFLPEA